MLELRQVAEMLVVKVPLFMSAECVNDKSMDFTEEIMYERIQACRSA